MEGKEKKGVAAWLVLIFGICFLALWGWAMLQQNQKNGEAIDARYNTAIEYMELGDYVGAMQIFDRLGGWKDSNDRYDECMDRLEEIQWAYQKLKEVDPRTANFG